MLLHITYAQAGEFAWLKSSANTVTVVLLSGRQFIAYKNRFFFLWDCKKLVLFWVGEKCSS